MSLSLPKCDFCKHYHKNIKDKKCCEAFPEGIPFEKITWGDEDEECANGIKFEDEKSRKSTLGTDSILAKIHRI